MCSFSHFFQSMSMPSLRPSFWQHFPLLHAIATSFIDPTTRFPYKSLSRSSRVSFAGLTGCCSLRWFCKEPSLRDLLKYYSWVYQSLQPSFTRDMTGDSSYWWQAKRESIQGICVGRRISTIFTSSIPGRWSGNPASYWKGTLTITRQCAHMIHAR